jgi:hypothetical protein
LIEDIPALFVVLTVVTYDKNENNCAKKHNMTYFLKERTVDAQKQPLLGNARTQ